MVVEFTERFRREYRRLDPQTASKADAAIRLICGLPTPLPKTCRHHTLSGFKPTIHVVDVTSNHAYQITFRKQGDVITLLRVATHRQIDHEPG